MNKQEAIKILTDIRDEANESEDAVCYVASEEDVEAIDMAIEALSVDRTGEWIEGVVEDLGLDAYTCSECKRTELSAFDFCPNCGAKMGGDTE